MSYSELLATRGSRLAIAITAIYWSAFSRLKGHFTVLTTLNALCSVHLAASAGALSVVELGPLCLTAGGTTLGLIRVSPTSVELLFLSGKGELGATVNTL